MLLPFTQISLFLKEKLSFLVRLIALSEQIKIVRDKTYYPKNSNKPPGGKVLVLSPHIDDDVIGCGGSIILHVAQGDKVKSVYLTDSSRGSKDEIKPEELKAIRKKEAYHCQEILGSQEPLFLDFKDLELKVDNSTISALKNVLDQEKPDLIYLPFFLDNHPDHLATAAIFRKILEEEKSKVKVISYELWTPLCPNLLIDISSVMAIKNKAIAAHQSQLKHVDYIRLSQGMSTYRSLNTPFSFAEAFWQASADEYLAITKRLIKN